MAPCKRLACHYLHTVDAYSRISDESLDWQSSTGEKSMSQVSKIRGLELDLHVYNIKGHFETPVSSKYNFQTSVYAFKVLNVDLSSYN